MKNRRTDHRSASTDTAARAPRTPKPHTPKNEVTYVLRLYITGSTPRAKAAVVKIKSFCEEHLKGHYRLEIIDIYQQPSFAKDEQIIAAPTLIKKLPRPLKRLVGDFSKTDRVISALDLTSR